MAKYIDTLPDKFEVCCLFYEEGTCGRDAKVNVAAHCKDGSVIYIPVCTYKSHVEFALVSAKEIEEGTDPHNVTGVDVEGLFIQPPGMNQKCKLTQWEADEAEKNKLKEQKRKKLEEDWKEEADPPEPIKQPDLPHIAPEKQVAVDLWTWVEDTDLWMDVQGRIIPISRLDREEFQSAVTSICEQNLARITAKNSWVKAFLTRDPKCVYPPEEMKVGSRKASEKLEEFHETAEFKGWL